MITAIVLAGGRSSRFGGDKLAADLDGRSLLAATIAAVQPIADGVAVAGPALPEPSELARLARPDSGEDTPVALFRDHEPYGGPLVALANVLGHALPSRSHLAIVVGGDMPRLVAQVLVRMLEVLDVDPTVDAVLLGRPEASGGSQRRPVLPLAIRIDPAAEAARAAVEAGDRSLQALVDRLALAELPAPSWLALDPEAHTLLDVDTPGDLDRVRAP